MTFHRAWLLEFELALLAVVPELRALPYWDITLDSRPGALSYVLFVSWQHYGARHVAGKQSGTEIYALFLPTHLQHINCRDARVKSRIVLALLAVCD
jgi:hypothetical protein